MTPPSSDHDSAPRLPDAFAAHFDHHVLAQESATLVAIDRAGMILWTNPAWSRFARENGAGEVLQRFGVGSSYFDGIGGSLRDYYERLFSHALTTMQVAEQEYECSSVEVLRIMRLRALPIRDGGLLLEHSHVKEGQLTRPSAQPMEPVYMTERGVILQCSNCRRVQRSDASGWDWVASWVSKPHPDVSHGICTICVGFYWGPQLGRLRKRSE